MEKGEVSRGKVETGRVSKCKVELGRGKGVFVRWNGVGGRE